MLMYILYDRYACLHIQRYAAITVPHGAPSDGGADDSLSHDSLPSPEASSVTVIVFAVIVSPELPSGASICSSSGGPPPGRMEEP